MQQRADHRATATARSLARRRAWTDGRGVSMARTLHSHSSHWGAFEAAVEDGQLVEILPARLDPDPSPLLDNIPGSLRHPTRVAQPMIRAGWLYRGPGPDARRGSEPFVPVSW